MAIALADPVDRKERLRQLDNLLWDVEEANLYGRRPSRATTETLRREGITLPRQVPVGFEGLRRIFARQVPYLNLPPRQARRQRQLRGENESEPE